MSEAPSGHAADKVTLYLGPRPLHELHHQALVCGPNRIDRAIDVLGVTPVASAAGVPVEVVAVLADRTVEPL